MESTNIGISVLYSLFLLGTLITYKMSAKPTVGGKPPLKAFSVNRSPYLTIYKYMIMRYTVAAGFVCEKQYLLMQLATLSLYQIVTLRINQVVLWGLGMMPVGLAVAILALEWRQLRGANTEEERDLKRHEPKNVVSNEEIAKICVVALSGLFQIAAVITIARSVSNLGQLNICSVLISFACDQLLHRPLVFLVLLCTIRIIAISRPSVLNSGIVSHMLVSQYLRNNLEQRVVPESSASPPRKQELSPCRVPKASTSSRFDEPNTLLEVFRQSKCDKKQEEEEAATKIQNICLDDRLYPHEQHQTIDPSEKGDPIKQHSETSEECLFMDPNKQNMATVDLKLEYTGQKPEKSDKPYTQNMHDDDIYLAQNIFPSKHEQTLPITITLSPIRQRKPTRSNRRRNNRVLLLTGDSPYLEYLPDMLKKQESENKVRHKDKLHPVAVKSDLAGSQLKDFGTIANLREIRR